VSDLLTRRSGFGGSKTRGEISVHLLPIFSIFWVFSTWRQLANRVPVGHPVGPLSQGQPCLHTVHQPRTQDSEYFFLFFRPRYRCAAGINQPGLSLTLHCTLTYYQNLSRISLTNSSFYNILKISNRVALCSWRVPETQGRWP
jgi:hypothetical protein